MPYLTIQPIQSFISFLFFYEGKLKKKWVKIKYRIGFIFCVILGVACSLSCFAISASTNKSNRIAIAFDFMITIIQELTITPFIGTAFQMILLYIWKRELYSLKAREFILKKLLMKEILDIFYKKIETRSLKNVVIKKIIRSPTIVYNEENDSSIHTLKN